MTRRSWQQAFWEKVHKTSYCWIWKAAVDKDGYGKFGTTRSDSRSYSQTSEMRSHRISWVLAYGPIPGRKLVRHSCDNPGCVNPQHLLLGTVKSNAEDRVQRGRGRRMDGVHNPNSKLTPEKIRAIRKACASGRSRYAVAKAHDIHVTHVGLIVRKKIWRYV